MVKGTSAYWKRFLGEVLSMVKQLGMPIFLRKLSCADLRSDELIPIIATLHGKKLSNEEMHNMDFFTRCSHLILNPVLLARHFQYRGEQFFKGHCFRWPIA